MQKNYTFNAFQDVDHAVNRAKSATELKAIGKQLAKIKRQEAIDRYIKSLPRTRMFSDYTMAKRWFSTHFPDATGAEYDRFNFRVAEKLGV